LGNAGMPNVRGRIKTDAGERKKGDYLQETSPQAEVQTFGLEFYDWDYKFLNLLGPEWRIPCFSVAAPAFTDAALVFSSSTAVKTR